MAKRRERPSSDSKEHLIINPPYTVFGTPHIETSQSIIMKVGGLRKMIKGLSDEDSFRIKWFAGYKATEYSYIKTLAKNRTEIVTTKK